ncbi:MAG TPA: hypothetical protein VKT77_16840 [Chthonomonadaceae bacterium]|nr:hypothetical protein [Chthonomonadaceae bacterium]
MRNRKSLAILTVGAIAAIAMLLFPPFFDVGGLFGGVRLGFLLRPPAPNPALDVRPALAVETLLLQLVAVAGFSLAGALAHETGAPRSRQWILRGAVAIAVVFTALVVEFSATAENRGFTSAPFLLCMIPVQFPGGYFLFWLRLAALAMIALAGTLFAGYRSDNLVRNSILTAVLAGGFGVVGLAAARAAIRFWN